MYSCSAGVGRTGTFICIDNVLEQIKKEKVVDIAGAINKMRHQRMKMVQTPVSSTVLLCRPSTSHTVDPSPSTVFIVEESLVVYKNTPQYFHRDYESGSGLVVLYRDFFMVGFSKQPATGRPAVGLPQLALAS